MLSIVSCTSYSYVYTFWRNILSSPMPIFELGCLEGFVLGCRVLCIFWILYSYQIWFVNSFSHTTNCPFNLKLSFDTQKFLILLKPNLSISFCVSCVFGVCEVLHSFSSPPKEKKSCSVLNVFFIFST